MDKDKPFQLAYHVKPKRPSRWMRAGLVVLLAAGTVAAWRFRFPVAGRVTMLYHQHQIASYSDPPGMVVYEEEPGRAAALLASSPRYQPVDADVEGDPRDIPIPTGHIPNIFAEYWDRRCFPSTVFLHERRTALGGRRLVLVDLVLLDVTPSGRTLEMFIRTRMLAPLLSGNCDEADESGATAKLLATDCLRLFAGEPSNDDAAKFMIPYEFNGVRGEIEGSLDEKAKPSLAVKSGSLKLQR